MTGAIATGEAVEQAVIALSDLGRPVTADAVIKKLGGGSKTTVTAHLRELAPKLTKANRELANIPATVRAAINRTAVQLWAAAEEEAKLNSVEIQKRYESFLSGQQEDLLAVTSERDQLQGQVSHPGSSVTAVPPSLMKSRGLYAMPKSSCLTPKRRPPSLKKRTET